VLSKKFETSRIRYRWEWICNKWALIKGLVAISVIDLYIMHNNENNFELKADTYSDWKYIWFTWLKKTIVMAFDIFHDLRLHNLYCWLLTSRTKRINYIVLYPSSEEKLMCELIYVEPQLSCNKLLWLTDHYLNFLCPDYALIVESVKTKIFKISGFCLNIAIDVICFSVQKILDILFEYFPLII